MYEIWLVMNIVYEIALSMWPLLAIVLAVWLLMLWAARARLGGAAGRQAWVLGLVLGALVWWVLVAQGAAQSTSVPIWQLLVGGFLVGYGARLGNGCTSGHGICGLGSMQWPSLLAVLTFMGAAFLTANLAARWLA